MPRVPRPSSDFLPRIGGYFDGHESGVLLWLRRLVLECSRNPFLGLRLCVHTAELVPWVARLGPQQSRCATRRSHVRGQPAECSGGLPLPLLHRSVHCRDARCLTPAAAASLCADRWPLASCPGGFGTDFIFYGSASSINFLVLVANLLVNSVPSFGIRMIDFVNP